MFGLPVSTKKFAIDLKNEISEDNMTNGAAALAFFLMLAIFPAMIFFLSVLPFLPIDNLQVAVLDFMKQAMPGEASELLTGTVMDIVNNKSGSLLAFGTLGTIWAASSGIVAIMQQLNIVYDVEEDRSYLKQRLTAIALMFGFGALMVTAFALIVMGGQLQSWLGAQYGLSEGVLMAFAVLRWIIIIAMILLTFGILYYWGPNVEQKFAFITPGAVFGTLVIALASLAFSFYVSKFADYNATYGSIGAVIILMMWLYVTGNVLLLGAEVNSLIEHYHPAGKDKGEKVADGDSFSPTGSRRKQLPASV